MQSGGLELRDLPDRAGEGQGAGPSPHKRGALGTPLPILSTLLLPQGPPVSRQHTTGPPDCSTQRGLMGLAEVAKEGQRQCFPSFLRPQW